MRRLLPTHFLVIPSQADSYTLQALKTVTESPLKQWTQSLTELPAH